MAASKYRYSYNFWRKSEENPNNNNNTSLMESNLIEMKPEDSLTTSSAIINLPPPEMEISPEPVCTPNEEEEKVADNNDSISRPRRFIFGPTTQLFKSVLSGGGRLFSRSRPTLVGDGENTNRKSSSGSASSSGIETDNEIEDKLSETFMERRRDIDLASPTSVESVKTYAKLLEEENCRLRQFVEEVLPVSTEEGTESENLKEDVITMYGSTIADLQSQIKLLHQLLEDVEQNHKKEQGELLNECEQKLKDLQRQNELDLAQVVSDNQQLVDDILNSYFDEIHVWRIEFERETKMTLGQDCQEQKMISDGGGVDTTMQKEGVGGGDRQDTVALQLIVKFKELQPITQGLVLAGIGIIGLVFGYYSWPFISWAWPRLLAFASRIEAAEIIQTLTWLSLFIQSTAFKEFKEAWEQGKPLSPILVQNFGLDFFSSILRLAPSLFKRNRIPMAV